MRYLFPGVLFAALWASASVATKFGIQSAPPLVLANIRFLIAGILMLLYSYLLFPGSNRLPRGNEWKQIFVFSLLNTTIYLSAFVLAMKEVSAGIGSLSTATNPLMITVISALWLKRKMQWFEGVGIALGILGVCVATYPLLLTSHATVRGLLILLGGMLAVSAATVYYSSIQWRLTNVVINGWQVFLGGLSLLPVTMLFTDIGSTRWDFRFWGSVLWLILPVSIAALQLWFYLVRKDAVKASLWLFLCPIFGFIYAALILDEPITWYTYIGTALVIVGLWLGQRAKFR